MESEGASRLSDLFSSDRSIFLIQIESHFHQNLEPHQSPQNYRFYAIFLMFNRVFRSEMTARAVKFFAPRGRASRLTCLKGDGIVRPIVR